MAMQTCSQVGAARTHANNLVKFAKLTFLQEPGLCFKHIHKTNTLQCQITSGVAQRAFVLSYVCTFYRNLQYCITLNTWNQHATYGALLNNGQATLPMRTSFPRDPLPDDNHPMSGDIQLNPEPYLITGGELLSSPGVFFFCFV